MGIPPVHWEKSCRSANYGFNKEGGWTPELLIDEAPRRLEGPERLSSKRCHISRNFFRRSDIPNKLSIPELGGDRDAAAGNAGRLGGLSLLAKLFVHVWSGLQWWFIQGVTGERFKKERLHARAWNRFN